MPAFVTGRDYRSAVARIDRASCLRNTRGYRALFPTSGRSTKFKARHDKNVDRMRFDTKAEGMGFDCTHGSQHHRPHGTLLWKKLERVLPRR